MKPNLKNARQSSIAVAVGCFALAVCSATAEGGDRVAVDRVQLLPAGEFRGLNGAPSDVKHWYVDGAIAARLIAAVNSRSTALVIDYDHQSLYAAKTGVRAVAAAWWKSLEWVEGVGLFAVGVDWTAAARTHIEADEFRYISPVFTYDPKTGAVLSIVNAALTNTPNLDDMASVSQLVAASLLTQPEVSPMNEELLEQLRWMLNLPITATAEDVIAELQKAIGQIKAGPAQAAASFHVGNFIVDQAARIAALSTQAPDPAQYVPIDTFQATQKELTELRVAVNSEKVDGIVKGALADGRLLPAQETWARDLGKQNLAALSQFIEVATPNPALGGNTQTGGQAPNGNGHPKLTDAQLAVCSQMGIAPDAYAATLAEQTA